MMNATAIQTVQPTETTKGSPAAVYLAGLGSDASRKSQGQSLRVIAELFKTTPEAVPWHKFDYRLSQFVKNSLTANLSPSNVNRHLSALRGVLKSAWRMGLMSHDAYERARDVANVTYESIPAGRSLDQGELLALVKSCAAEGGKIATRDAAIIGVAYGAGLRRSELVNLNLEDFDVETGKLSVLNGKGRKSRRVFLKNGAKAALEDWIEIRGQEAGPMFYRVRRGGHFIRSRLPAPSIYTILKLRAAKASVEHFSPHDIRRTFAGDLMDAGADISSIQKLMGHADAGTTTLYDRRPERTREQASGLLHFPYKRN